MHVFASCIDWGTTTMKTFDISSNKITETKLSVTPESWDANVNGMLEFCRRISQCASLTQIDLSKCGLGTKGIEVLASIKWESAALKDIDISYNLITASKRGVTISRHFEALDTDVTGLTAFWNALSESCHIRRLSMQCCGLGPQAIVAIATKPWKNSAGIELNISENVFGGSSCVKLAPDTVVGVSLTKGVMAMHDNQWVGVVKTHPDNYGKVILLYVDSGLPSRPMDPSELVVFASREGIASIGYDHLQQLGTFVAASCIDALDMSNCMIGAAAMAEFVSVRTSQWSTSTLTNINVQRNPIGEAGLVHINAMMSQSQSLGSVCGIKPGQKHVALQSLKLPQLPSARIPDGAVGCELLLADFRAARTTHSIEIVDVTAFSLRQKGARTLIDALSHPHNVEAVAFGKAARVRLRGSVEKEPQTLTLSEQGLTTGEMLFL